jgi:hypothetical protein
MTREHMTRRIWRARMGRSRPFREIGDGRIFASFSRLARFRRAALPGML